MNCEELTRQLSTLETDFLRLSSELENFKKADEKDSERLLSLNSSLSSLESMRDEILSAHLDDFAEKNPELLEHAMLSPELETPEELNINLTTSFPECPKVSDTEVLVVDSDGNAIILKRQPDGRWSRECSEGDISADCLEVISETEILFIGRNKRTLLKKAGDSWTSEIISEETIDMQFIRDSERLSDTEILLVGGYVFAPKIGLLKKVGETWIYKDQKIDNPDGLEYDKKFDITDAKRLSDTEILIFLDGKLEILERTSDTSWGLKQIIPIDGQIAYCDSLKRLSDTEFSITYEELGNILYTGILKKGADGSWDTATFEQIGQPGMYSTPIDNSQLIMTRLNYTDGAALANYTATKDSDGNWTLEQADMHPTFIYNIESVSETEFLATVVEYVESAPGYSEEKAYPKLFKKRPTVIKTLNSLKYGISQNKITKKE